MTTQRTIGSTPKLRTLCSQLYEIALALGPGARMPTVVELRERTGVSMATLNSALVELEKQSIVTRRHGVGVFVSEQLHTRSVSLLAEVSHFHSAGHSPFWDILLEKSRARAASHNERFELHFSQPHGVLAEPFQRGLAADIAQNRVSGILGISLDENAARWLEAQKVPFVAIFGPAFGPHAEQIALDNAAMVRLGIETLKAKGCVRIGIWDTQEFQHLNVFAREMLAHDLPFRSEFCQFWNPKTPEGAHLTRQEHGYDTALRVFSQPRDSWPDGLLIVDDMMTHGALMALRKLGLVAGRDVQIATHANKGSISLLGHEGEFSLLEFDPDELVEAAFSHLESIMNGHLSDQKAIELQPRLRAFGAI